MWSRPAEFHILPEVAQQQPHQPFEISPHWRHLDGLPLADEQFNVPADVDVLIGAGLYSLIIRGDKLTGKEGEPIALSSELGWLILGTVTKASPIITSAICNTEKLMVKFIGQEEIEPPTVVSTPTVPPPIEQHFRQTHSRDEEGRYQGRLPIVENAPLLGESRPQAKSRYYQVRRRLKNMPDRELQYDEAFQALIDSGNMVPIPLYQIKKPPNECFYLPHHFVLKESSTTTKMRIVLDGSAKSSTGVSLNDILMNGPTIQSDLVSILMRFRTHQIALSADIKQMYHQVKVHPDDQDFLRIIWKDKEDNLKEYRLTRVPFGITPAPFMAVRCLFQLVEDEGKKFPLASPVLEKDFYIDDGVTGEKTVTLASKLQQQLSSLLEKGKFHLCKWSSNSEDVLIKIPEEDRELKIPLDLFPEENIKTLGVQWYTLNDSLSFKVTIPSSNKFTKRIILSTIARLFHPLGFLQPVIIIVKILMQDIWKRKLDWDEPVPDEIVQVWLRFLAQLPLIEKLIIPRKYFKSIPTEIELHGFSDASEKAYGAVIYVRARYTDNSYSSQIVTAKSKVAPLKNEEKPTTATTIPKLELMGAVILSRLMKVVEAALFNIKINQVYYWTDSSIVLNWIQNDPSKYETFVSNRLQKIRELSSPNQWHHVITSENSADCISRGLFPAEFIQSKLYHEGPSCLREKKLKIGPIPGSKEAQVLGQKSSKKNIIVDVTKFPEPKIITRNFPASYH